MVCGGGVGVGGGALAGRAPIASSAINDASRQNFAAQCSPQRSSRQNILPRVSTRAYFLAGTSIRLLIRLCLPKRYWKFRPNPSSWSWSIFCLEKRSSMR